MIFLIRKKDNSFYGKFSSIGTAMYELRVTGQNQSDFYITEDLGLKYISRIVYYDGRCVYNNRKFWSEDAYRQNLLLNYDPNKVKDILGLPVSKERFVEELESNRRRILAIDGRPGQIEYNMQVGNEFISLFREECILTDFKKESGITPLDIAQKLSSVIGLVQTGSFREAKIVLQQIQAYQPDAFLTVERLQKYINMLDAADVIEYATDEEYFYTVPEENK